ncbi:MAG: MATE family efflux transporter [Bacteroidales bacterium]
MKDSIDFANTDIATLFRKMLYPTVFSMVFSAVFIITDGIFVGHGIGSDALAAINIVSPIWLFTTGIGLMFGMGGSVVASINLSQGKLKTARINITQAVFTPAIFLLLCSALILGFSEQVLLLLGSSEKLMPLAKDYLWGFVPFMAVNGLFYIVPFFIRLDGSPNFAMIAGMVAMVINIILDYLFIFVFGWGIFGAAIATSLGSIIGIGIMLYYLFDTKNELHFIRIKLSKNSFLLTVRNIGYMCHLGFSSFLCEVTISTMMLCGNYEFIDHLGETGVAAFSIACYFFPVIFMLYNAIIESAQPIISYNHGANKKQRAKDAFSLALKTAVICGTIFCILTFLFSSEISSMFIDSDAPAHEVAALGLPLFAIGFIPFAVNIISIGYFQSVERIKSANIVTAMRGFVFITLAFIITPKLMGTQGIWLAVPIAELVTVLLVVAIYIFTAKKEDKL